jgi:hypothetical protein
VAFDLAGITDTVAAPFFAFFAKGGSRECRCQVGLITCPQQNQIAHAASPPTLAKNARMGTLCGDGAGKHHIKAGPPTNAHSQKRKKQFGVELSRGGRTDYSKLSHGASCGIFFD